MADKKINDLPLQSNPTGNMQIETDIGGATPNKIQLGDSPSDNFTTTSKTIMGAVNELDANKAEDADVVHKTGNLTETITGFKTFEGNIVCEQDVTIYDDLTVGGTGDNLNGQIRIRDKNGAVKFDLEGKDTGAAFTFNTLPTITNISQGAADNDKLITQGYADGIARHIRPVIALPTGGALTIPQSGSIVTNKGAIANQNYTLVTADSASEGVEYYIHVLEDFRMTFGAAGSSFRFVEANGDTITAGSCFSVYQYSHCILRNVGEATRWLVIVLQGRWTA